MKITIKKVEICRCPHCNQELKYGQELFGEIVDCPECDGRIQLPEHKIIKPKVNIDKPKKSKMPALIMVCIILFTASYVLSPIVSIKSFQKALDNEDVVAVESYIDMPSLKSNFASHLKTEIAKQSEEIGGLTTLMSLMMVNSAVDTLSVEQIMIEYKEAKNSGTAINVNWNFRYINPNTFKFGRDDSDSYAVWKRYGLFSWKMVDIKII